MFKKRSVTKFAPIFGLSNKKSSLFVANYWYVSKRNYAIGNQSKQTASSIIKPVTDTKQTSSSEAPNYQKDRKEIVVETLPNGAVLATTETSTPQANISLFVRNAGTRTETVDTLGYSHLLKHLGFTRTLNRSPVRLAREFELASSQYSVSVEREVVSFKADLLSDDCLDIYTLLLDVLRPKLREYVIRESGYNVTDELHALEHCHATKVWELLHKTAFRGTGLGNPLYCPSERIPNFEFTPLENFEKFILERYMPEDLVIVSSGISPSVAKEMIAETFDDLDDKETDGDWTPPVRDPASTLPSKYHGGETLVYSEDGHHNQFALAFEGVSLSDKDWYAAQVLTKIIGKGTVAPLVGPGCNGLSSSLLSKHLFDDGSVHEFTAFSQSYSDTGIFGVYANTKPKATNEVVKKITGALNGLKNKVDAADLKRGIKQTQVAWLKQAESQSGFSDFVGRQIISGVKQPLNPLQFIKQFEVKEDDIKRVAKRILSSSPTLAVVGDLVNVPYVGDIKKSLA